MVLLSVIFVNKMKQIKNEHRFIFSFFNLVELGSHTQISLGPLLLLPSGRRAIVMFKYHNKAQYF